MKLTIRNLDKVIKQVETYKNKTLMEHFSARVREFAEEVRRIADSLYHNAADGENRSVLVSVDQLERTETTVAYLISANGEGVVFLEFGAGDTTDYGDHGDWTAKMAANGIPIVKGSYSSTIGSGEYARTGQWHFGGEVYRGVFPRRALYQAVQNAIASWREKQ